MMMDDCCAVCAEALEWVAYGPCGHREVCSTCVSRLRVVCQDRRCCLCQSDSAAVFVTKALGEYTRSISDFSVFPDDAKEGKVGSFWYHEGIQAFFDDFNQYKAIRAMSKLSCGICDKSDGKGKEGSKRKGKFKSIDHLRSHVSSRHELFMCSLCLEGRKVFISEQKLYNRAQLERHFEKGDLEVDGDESERCGFSGHPLCEFCQLNFYGDNELYFHLSTDHFICHICQRQHPGSYQYYGDYYDLEKHFRHTHYLCEDYSCLEKKFIVFATAFEMKKHRSLEHGRNVSRSECNASLQISACFRYLERNDRDSSRSRSVGQIFNAELSHDTSSSTHRFNGGSSLTSISDVRSAEPVVSSGHSQATGSNSNWLLEDTAFPPLPSSSKRRNCKSRNTSSGTGKAPQLHRRYDGSLTVVNSSSCLPAPSSVSCQPSSSSVASSSRPRNTSNSGRVSLLDTPASSQTYLLSNCANSTVGISLNTTRDNSSISSLHSLINGNYIREVGPNSPSRNILNSRSFDTSTCTVISSAKTNELPAAASGEGVQKMEEIQTLKSLVGKICAELGFDKDKYAAFKLVSREYRQGVISAREYLAHVHQFGLSHFAAELARVCPDPEKRMELLKVCNSSLRESVGVDGETSSSMAKTGSKKGKEKCIDHQSSSAIDFRERDKSNIEASCASRKGKEKCTGNGDGHERDTQPDGNPIAVKGKEKYVDNEIYPGRMPKACSAESKGKHSESLDAGDGSNDPAGVNKKNKKTPKFLHSLINGNYIREVGPNSPSLNILNSRSFDTSTCTVTSSAKTNELPAAASGGGVQKMEEIQTLKSLVGKICAELGFDKDKCAAFKLVSKEYRQGVISAREYLAYVHQFGLSHFAAELARLCPDPEKRMELLEVCNSSLRESVGVDGETSSSMAKTGSKKGKEKCIDHQSSSAIDFRERDKRNIEASRASRKGKEKCTGDGDGHEGDTRPDGNSIAVKGKEKYVDNEIYPGRMPKACSAESKGKHSESLDAGDGSNDPTGVNKKNKKTPKFLRARLGESSTSVLPDPEGPKSTPAQTKVSVGRSAGLT